MMLGNRSLFSFIPNTTFKEQPTPHYLPRLMPSETTQPSSPRRGESPTPTTNPGSPASSPGVASWVPAKSYTGELAGFYYNAMNSMNSALSSEYRLQSNAKAYIMGSLISEGKEANQCTTAHARAVSYYTYRNRFPKPLANGADHDAGWGCMVRTGQMMLSEAVRRVLQCTLPSQDLKETTPTTSKRNLTLNMNTTSLSSTGSGAAAASSSSVVFPRPQPDCIRNSAPVLPYMDAVVSDRVHSAASLFYDSPAAPFGIHNLTAAAAHSAKLPVGQWFTPTALTRAVSHIMEVGLVANSTKASSLTSPRAAGSIPDHDHLMVGIRSSSETDIGNANNTPVAKEVVAEAVKHIRDVFEFVREHLKVIAPLDGSVCADDVLDALRGPEIDLCNDSIEIDENDKNDEMDIDIDNIDFSGNPAAAISSEKKLGTSVLLMVPVMAGAGGTLSDAYRKAVLRCLELPSSLGIVGGKPNKSLYFIGHQEDAVFYLDPHTVQTAFVSPTTISARSGPKGTASVALIDTSMVMCFYFKDEKAFLSFREEFKPIAELTPFPLFSFITADQKHQAEASSKAFDDADVDDMGFDEDDEYDAPPSSKPLSLSPSTSTTTPAPTSIMKTATAQANGRSSMPMYVAPPINTTYGDGDDPFDAADRDYVPGASSPLKSSGGVSNRAPPPPPKNNS